MRHYTTRLLLRVTERTKTREKTGKKKEQEEEEEEAEKVKEKRRKRRSRKPKKEKMMIGKEKSLSQRSSFDTRLSCPSNAKVHLKKPNISSVLCPSCLFLHQSHLGTIRLFILLTLNSFWPSSNKLSLLLLLLFSIDRNLCMPA